jgi:nucleotide-binding universal stress UspA family protein
VLRLVNARGWISNPHVGDIGLDQHAYHEGLGRQADRRLVAAVEVARVAAPTVEIDRATRDGYASEVLTDESTRAEMLVLGNRGHGGFVGLLAGSVAVAMAAVAECPVVVVREAVDPGLQLIVPIVDVMHRVSLRIVTMPIQSQGIITRDNVRCLRGGPLPRRRRSEVRRRHRERAGGDRPDRPDHVA